MCTVKLAPAARVTGPQVSVCGAAGLDGQGVGQGRGGDPGGRGILEHDPAGSGSVTVTPVAVPAPVLVTVTWNPIGSPAFTVAASAVLRMWIDAWLQVMPAED